MRARLLVVVLALATIAGGAVLFACSQTPTSVPIRTFERARKMDVICLRVLQGILPIPQPQEECAPVPPEVNGGSLANRLYALVTQTGRGEVAVVDLSAGVIVDQSHAVPGLNFLPVGAAPTDIAALPDGKMAFVSSAEPNKFAIYGIPGENILGDQAGKPERVTLASWPVCLLPQRPGALAIVPRRQGSADADAGVGDGGAGGTPLAYELAVVLPGDRVDRAKVVTIDPRVFLDASRPDKLQPGQPVPCPLSSAIELEGEAAIPATFTAGAAWDDGVKWVDGGVDLTCDVPPKSPRCGLPSCRCVQGDGGAADDAGACDPDAGTGAPAEQPLDLGPLDAPRPIAVARDDQTLYVADGALPLIHVIDLSVPGSPRELAPFIVPDLVDPSRPATVKDVAISPATSEFKRFLYAVDGENGSIAVFDVTDPVNAPRTPMRRPHAELNPFQPPDRIVFAAPVVSVAFARHDFPLARRAGVPLPAAQTGVICNPNQNADGGVDFGVDYRANSTNIDAFLGPTRLRGVFAFATLSNGLVVAIDVDDWDAPCRRPETLDGTGTGLLSVAQPTAPGDVHPYHAPVATPESVTDELFFPVSAPHRARSAFYLRDDSQTGKHVPFLPSVPSIQSLTGPLPLFGQGSEATPRLRPTALAEGVTSDTERVEIRFSFDTPDVHFDQDWSVIFEGALPGFEGFPGTLKTRDNYASLDLEQPQARFCAKGVEDWALGIERAEKVTSALTAAGRSIPPERALSRRVVDYVQVIDEILPAEDAFWSQPDLPDAEACWDPRLSDARSRHDFCSSVFGPAGEESTNRDFPILEAYDDRLRLGRFGSVQPDQLREVVYADPSNVPHLKLLRCCFHSQVRFNIRASSQWVTVGSLVGFLNHNTRDPGGRCVPSCDPREALLNSRVVSIPFGANEFAPVRDSPLAMRNPSFSFFIQNGQTEDGGDSLPRRDYAYRFQTRGGYVPLSINLAASTTAVNPQSMRFIDSLGQIAVVDGATQGLVLIDLAGVAIARQPYF